MKKLAFILLLMAGCINSTLSQEYFTITKYKVDITVNKDASLDIKETILVHFTEQRHGIIRFIPYKYYVQPLPEGTEKADRQLEANDYVRTIIENIKVDNWKYEVSRDGDYKSIKIGSADKYVDGNQQYVIRYRVLNAINFFKDYSELYFNIIGDKWETTIESADFSISLYSPLPDSPAHFVATGRYGSVENNTRTSWDNSYQVFTGTTTRPLDPNEGVTVGIRFPQGFLTKQDYTLRGVYWLLLPAIVFLLMYLVWKRWGKDDPVTVRTEYYPPDNISPAISGYMIDGMLNRRDLTALVPYWGAGGYLQVREVEDESFFGLVKNKEYEFIKLKELPDTAPEFEKTMFHGIFKTGDQVMLKDLKDELYKAMAEAKKELEREINRREYYVKGSRGFGVFLVIAGLIVVMAGVTSFDAEQMWRAISIFLSAAIMLFFGVFMAKRTKKGTALYQQLAGFREFIRSVERDRLKEFLKQDEHYFDKILPYAIVFNVADTWKDKLEGLDVPPPNWYHGSYAHFSTGSFMHSLHNSMNSMSDTFYSSPSGSGSSGGSFGGGGSSGGGFGGGGGSSW